MPRNFSSKSLSALSCPPAHFRCPVSDSPLPLVSRSTMPSHRQASPPCSRLAVDTSPSPELRTHSPILLSRCIFYFTSTHAQPGVASSIQTRVLLCVDNEHILSCPPPPTLPCFASQ